MWCIPVTNACLGKVVFTSLSLCMGQPTGRVCGTTLTLVLLCFGKQYFGKHLPQIEGCYNHHELKNQDYQNT